MKARDRLFKSFPIIETKNFVLRELSLKDFNILSDLLNSYDTQKYQTHFLYEDSNVFNYIYFQKEKFINREVIKWVIERKRDKAFIGLRVLYCDDYSGWVEIQGDTFKEYWNKGFTKGAYLAILKHLKKCGFKGVFSRTQSANLNSYYLLKSLGFKHVKSFIRYGVEFDDYIYVFNYNFFERLLNKIRGA